MHSRLKMMSRSPSNKLSETKIESWLVAMEEEMQSLHKNKTWEVCPWGSLLLIVSGCIKEKKIIPRHAV